MRLLCKLGLHGRFWVDSAGFISATRCGHCNEPTDKRQADRLDMYRKLWDEVPKNLPYIEQERWVSERYFRKLRDR